MIMGTPPRRTLGATLRESLCIPPLKLSGLGEPDLERCGVLRCETEEPLSLACQGVAILPGQGLEGGVHERGVAAGPLGLPRPADEAVDEEGGWDHAVPRGDCLAI